MFAYIKKNFMRVLVDVQGLRAIAPLTSLFRLEVMLNLWIYYKLKIVFSIKFYYKKFSYDYINRLN